MGLRQKGLEKCLRKSALPYESPHPSPDHGEHLLYLSVVWRTRGVEGIDELHGKRIV